ncbi:ATP-dependent RNA helicase A [Giardia muris]|uniref:ATP-dependent RNA helicase A n=1 Tax=Giardia muris TaxID=5742 RepID=A0A4Z1SQR3_GIAMU|nr:ATP-dependent RNA helicase A [Giardia muris]|eukprot:TNJ28202.1 ATP-dependent RNA helicase A [Giardia muris]
MVPNIAIPSNFGRLLRSPKPLLIVGPTGCGKSTGIPDMIMKLIPDARVIMTQPRRLAAERIAEYVARQNSMTIGSEVGICMGRKKIFSSSSKLIMATAGSAFNIVTMDPERFDIIIIDEIHERGIDTRKMIALAHSLYTSRSQKVILMSATVDPEALKKEGLLPDLQTINVERRDRSYTVTKCYFDDNELEMEKYSGQRPVEEFQKAFSKFISNPARTTSAIPSILCERTHSLVKMILSTQSPIEGSILVFLPGMREIEEFMKELDKWARNTPNIPSYKLHILHSACSSEYQSDVLTQVETASTVVQIILATSVCETSLTLPSVVYVVDSCLQKMRRFVGGEFRLVMIGASQEAMTQRCGRVGRTRDGVYYSALDQSLLRCIKKSYSVESIFETIDDVILRMLGSPVLRQAFPTLEEITQFLTTIDPQVDQCVGIVPAVIDRLEAQGLIYVQDGEQKDYYLTELGAIPYQIGHDVGMGVNLSWYYYLGIPYTGLSTSVLLLSLPGALFLNNYERNFNASTYSLVSVSTPVVLLVACQGYEQFNDDQYMLSLAHQRTTAASFMSNNPNLDVYSCFSDRVAYALVFAHWRRRFPNLTQIPTKEENQWCRLRGLSSSGLREVAIEACSQRRSLASAGLLSTPPEHELLLSEGMYVNPSRYEDTTFGLVYKEVERYTLGGLMRLASLAELFSSPAHSLSAGTPITIDKDISVFGKKRNLKLQYTLFVSDVAEEDREELEQRVSEHPCLEYDNGAIKCTTVSMDNFTDSFNELIRFFGEFSYPDLMTMASNILLKFTQEGAAFTLPTALNSTKFAIDNAKRLAQVQQADSRATSALNPKMLDLLMCLTSSEDSSRKLIKHPTISQVKYTTACEIDLAKVAVLYGEESLLSKIVPHRRAVMGASKFQWSHLNFRFSYAAFMVGDFALYFLVASLGRYAYMTFSTLGSARIPCLRLWGGSGICLYATALTSDSLKDYAYQFLLAFNHLARSFRTVVTVVAGQQKKVFDDTDEDTSYISASEETFRNYLNEFLPQAEEGLFQNYLQAIREARSPVIRFQRACLAFLEVFSNPPEEFIFGMSGFQPIMRSQEKVTHTFEQCPLCPIIMRLNEE